MKKIKIKVVKKPAVKKKTVKKGRLKPITSLFDLSMKMKEDERYEAVLIKAYNYHDRYKKPTVLKAKKWLNEWIENLQPNQGCADMVAHINRYMREFNERH